MAYERVMKRQITKAEYFKLGGETNPKLFRTMKGGRWTYWRTE